MPGLRPTPPEPDPEPNENEAFSVNFSYMRMQSQTGQVFYAMTFQQIISFLTDIRSRLDEDESAIFHLDRINEILRKFIQDGD